ncbi:CDC27 family protein, partial [Candidatus Bipolaricaulota bacterium]|nr:CDC27 family protein [Candidatus Bipolaricaulota bacterium]
MNNKISRVLAFPILVVILLSLIQFFPGVLLSRSSELTEVSGEFIEAVEALDQDQYGKATRLLEKYSGDPPLGDYSTYLLARANLGGGKYEKALSVLEKISPGNGVLSFEKFYLKSKVLLEMGRPGLAGESAERALGKAVTEEEKRKILELQLTIAVNSNNYSAALKRGIDLVEVTNLRFVGEKRVQLLDRLGEIIREVDFDTAEPLEYLSRYVELLMDYGEYRRARSILLRNMGNWTGSLKYRAYFDLAWIDGFKVDHPEEARWTFQRLLGMNLPDWFEAKAKYYHTLFQAGETSDYDLVESLLEVGREFPGSYFGGLAVNRAFSERTKGASTLTLDHELERFKNSMTRSAVKDVTWRLFYRSFSEGKYKLAKDYLVSLESFYNQLPPELVFWRYKTNASSNGSTDYLKLVAEQNENPVNYYSLLESRKGWSRGSFDLRDTWKARELDLEEYEIKVTEKDLPTSLEKSLVYSIVFKNHGLYETALNRLKRLEPEMAPKDYLFLKSQWKRLAGEYKASLKSSTELMRWYYSNNQSPPLTVV